MEMRLGNICLSLILSSTLLLAGCIDIPRTVSPGSPLWGGYEAGKEYQLIRDAFIVAVDDGMEGKRLALCPEGAFEKRARYHSVPHTVEAYQKDPVQAVIIKHEYGSFRINVDGIVYAGTLLSG